MRTKNLSPWGRSAKIAMIQKGMSVSDIADAAHLSRAYVSAIINERVISPKAINAISDVLGIPTPATRQF